MTGEKTRQANAAGTWNPFVYAYPGGILLETDSTSGFKRQAGIPTQTDSVPKILLGTGSSSLIIAAAGQNPFLHGSPCSPSARALSEHMTRLITGAAHARQLADNALTLARRGLSLDTLSSAAQNPVKPNCLPRDLAVTSPVFSVVHS